MEEWRDIKGFEGLYQVSNLGRVRSLKDAHGRARIRVLKAQKYRNGYLYVGLSKNGKLKPCTVHRLVATAFIPNPDNLPCINHRDECKTNNIVTNLEWCDAAYNINYGTRNERDAEKKSVRVYQYTLDGSFVRSYPSLHEAERRTGSNFKNISACCLGKRKSAGNYRWSYDPPTPTQTRVLF